MDKTIDWEHVLTEGLNFPPELIDTNVLDFFKEVVAMAYLYAKKNSDYGNSFTKGMDEIGNAYGVGRLYDKMNRLLTLAKKEARVKDESIQDTVRDLACYSIMLNNYWNSKK